ncbi:MAG: thiamine-phosphate kinase [Spirochaetes bacterium]|nr:thiamine-phosphate kinase [Spirochaetota bacterium]
MLIKELGGEFALIDRIAKNPRDENVMVSIGDDCAVVDMLNGKLMLQTVDMLVENDHFSRRYFSPYDIGWKAMISNVSDIASCGGAVKYALISIALTFDISVEFMDDFYRGVYDAAERYSFDIIGGDTTHGALMSISITLTGETTKENLRLRSHAKAGDLIAVSAPLGGSTAGLKLFLKNIEGHENVKKYHIHPECGMDLLSDILPVSHAMTDVSDGLASEARNIAGRSSLSAHIYKTSIKLSEGIVESASLLGDDPYDYALFGGEDFALVYTVPREKASEVKGFIVGEMKEGEGVYIDGKKITRFGYDHFA